MTPKKKIILILIILVAASAFVYFAIVNAGKKQAETGLPKNAVPVELEAAHTETIVSKVVAKGSVELIHSEEVYPETQARIKRLTVKSGDMVEKDQILIEYDDSHLDGLNDQLEEAKLALRAAQIGLKATQLPASESERVQSAAQIDQARQAIEDIYTRAAQYDLAIAQINGDLMIARDKQDDIRTLYEEGVVARTDLDAMQENIKKLEDQIETTRAQKDAVLAEIPAAEGKLDTLETQYELLMSRSGDPAAQNQAEQQQVAVEQAELRIRQIQKQIDDFTKEERSPVSGTVINLYVTEGETTMNGKALMDIASLSGDNLVIRVNVPENYAGRVRMGQDVEIRGDAMGKDVYMGKLTHIAPVVVSKQIKNSIETVLEVEVSPEDSAMVLRPGYTVETSIITNIANDTVVVPLMSTVSESSSEVFVYIMRDDYTVEKRPIVMGEYAGIYVEASGVRDGEKIILSPSAYIQEGVYVKPIASMTGE